MFNEQQKCPRLSPLIKWYGNLFNERLSEPHIIIIRLFYYITADNRYLLQIPYSLIYTFLFLNHHALGRRTNIGDRVYILFIEPPHQSPKLARRWNGPYLVTNIFKFGKYILK